MKIAIAGTGCACLSSGQHHEMVVVDIADPFFDYGSDCLPKVTKQPLAHCGEVFSNLIKETVDASCTRTNFIADLIAAIPIRAMCSEPA